MVEVSKKLVETMHCWKVFIAVAEMVLAELSCCISQRLQQFRNRRVLSLQSHRSSRETNFSKAGAETTLPGDERRASCSTALLAVGICEHHALLSEAVDVRSLVPHNSMAVTAKILNTYVVSPDDEDIGLRARFLRHGGCSSQLW